MYIKKGDYMKSVCIKTNNQKVISYLLLSLENIKMDHLYYSCLKFKIYQNIIIHYTGKDIDSFICQISHMLSRMVIHEFEEKFLKKILVHEYFYFDSLEQNSILNNIFNILDDDDFASKENLLYNSFYFSLSSSNKLFLDGFIPFRVKPYLNYLAKKVDTAVNRFLVDREYTEFISILKMYIESEPSTTDFVHLIYYNSRSILLDRNKKIIEIDSNMFNAKYLSDITFSSNDYALNTLLSMLPKKIYVHLIDNNIDEFIQTLKLIFESRIVFCNDCDICRVYRKKYRHSNLERRLNHLFLVN